MNEIVAEGLVLIAAGRAYVASRPLALARPRRGNIDLPDRDKPDRAQAETPPRTETPAAPGDRWIVPAASVGLAAVVGTVAGAVTLI